MPDPPTAAAARVSERSLAFFADPAGGCSLTSAERVLLDACERGVHAALNDPRGDDERRDNPLPRPAVKDDSTTIRAEFLRFLILGGDADAPVNDRTIELFGAYVTGRLDLTGAIVTRIISIVACVVEETVRLDFAATKSVNFARSELRGGLSAEGLKCDGSLWLRETDSRRSIALSSATIEGFFLAEGASFAASRLDEWALYAEGLHVARTIRLGRAFDGQRRSALICGGLMLDGATISGDLVLDEARFVSLSSCLSLSCQRTDVGGTFSLRQLGAVGGMINVGAMKVAILADDLPSWRQAAGRLVLDGFVYDRLASDAVTNAAARRQWLAYQAGEAGAFRPQPWGQLVTALRAGGHPLDATRLAIMQETAYRDAGKVRGWGPWTAHWLHDKLVSYGYKPERLAYWLLGLWCASAIAYALVAPASPDDVRRARDARRLIASDLLVPAKSAVDVNCLADHLRARSAAACPKVAERKEFSAVAYSSDNLVPGLKLGAADDWAFNWRTTWPRLVPPAGDWAATWSRWCQGVVLPPAHDWAVAALFVLVWTERIVGGVGFGVLGLTVGGYLFRKRE